MRERGPLHPGDRKGWDETYSYKLYDPQSQTAFPEQTEISRNQLEGSLARDIGEGNSISSDDVVLTAFISLLNETHPPLHTFGTILMDTLECPESGGSSESDIGPEYRMKLGFRKVVLEWLNNQSVTSHPGADRISADDLASADTSQ